MIVYFSHLVLLKVLYSVGNLSVIAQERFEGAGAAIMQAVEGQPGYGLHTKLLAGARVAFISVSEGTKCLTTFVLKLLESLVDRHIYMIALVISLAVLLDVGGAFNYMTLDSICPRACEHVVSDMVVN